VRHTRPEIYQKVNGARQLVNGAFHLVPDGTVSLQLGDYDPRYPLVIDPRLIYTASFGWTLNLVSATVYASLSPSVSGTAVDSAGNLYMTGTAFEYGASIPLVNAVQSACPAVHCAFVSKLSPDGKTTLYSTFVGSPVDSLTVPLTNESPIVPAGIACEGIN
jgi:hypothetical protein